MSSLVQKVKEYLDRGNARSVAAKKNIAGSFLNKCIAIFVSLALVPLTINFVSSEQYGIWLTVSSVVGWMSYFDIGFANGFRNKFAEAKANGDMLLARKYVSTTYVLLGIIFSIVAILALVVNQFLDWKKILNLSEDYNLTLVFDILIVLFCFQMILQIYNTLLNADQKPALSAFVVTIGQILVLVCVVILTHTVKEGNLLLLSWILLGIPCITTLIISIIAFNTKYKSVAPAFRYVEFRLTKNVISLGIKFFIIQISIIFTFQLTNIILLRVVGPLAVTQYNVVYKYFSAVIMIVNIILSPYWSAFTDAFTQKDFAWMYKSYKRLSIVTNISAALLFLMIFIAPFIFRIWLRDSVTVSMDLVIMMALYSFVIIKSSLNMTLIKGIGCIQLQMFLFVFLALCSIPLAYWACKNFGVLGGIVEPLIVYLVQYIFCSIQIKKILSNKASGIWIK